jgi:hypothetical protein
MASLGGLVYSAIFAAVMLMGFIIFFSGLQANYSTTIANSSTINSTFANSLQPFTNNQSGFYNTSKNMANTTSGGDLAGQIGNAFLYVIPGRQWAWSTMTTIFNYSTAVITLITETIDVFSIPGFPINTSQIVGVLVSIFIGFELLSWYGKYKMQGTG